MTNELTKENARICLQPFYEAFLTGDVESLNQCFAAEWRDNTLPPNRPQGLSGLKQAIVFLRGILPDVAAIVEDLRLDGDIAAVRITFKGTNTGGFPGVGPNANAVSFVAFDMHRISGGKVVESWHLEDNLTLMIQLGVVPPLG